MSDRLAVVGELYVGVFSSIAALCLQHSLPLLTNDRGFDSIEGLAVIHW